MVRRCTSILRSRNPRALVQSNWQIVLFLFFSEFLLTLFTCIFLLTIFQVKILFISCDNATERCVCCEHTRTQSRAGIKFSWQQKNASYCLLCACVHSNSNCRGPCKMSRTNGDDGGSEDRVIVQEPKLETKNGFVRYANIEWAACACACSRAAFAVRSESSRNVHTTHYVQSQPQ